MASLREIEERVLSHGSVHGHDVDLLRQSLYHDGKIDRKEANFLVELHRRVQNRTPPFEQFYYKAIKDHILADGRITAGETDWLRYALVDNNKIEDEGRKFLTELKGEAQEVSPEFEAFYKQVMKLPPEQRTSG